MLFNYKDNLGKYYNYDEKGNLIEVANSGVGSTNSDYNEGCNLKEYTDQAGASYKFTYENNRIKTVSDIEDNVVSFDYDDRGNVNSLKLKTRDGEVLETSQTYDLNDNPISIIDEKGNKTVNSFDSFNRLQKSTAPNGLVTTYKYSKFGELSSLIGGIGENSLQGTYEYEKGLIKKITTANGTVYDFVYDAFGNIKKVYVDDALIADYEYKYIQNLNSGLIEKKNYGDNSYSFKYDSKRRLIKVLYNNNLLVQYKYNEMDLVSELHDVENGTIKHFNYDQKGKLIKITEDDNYIRYVYDNLDNPQKVSYKIDDDTRDFDFEYTYEYNEYNKDGYVNRLDKAFMDDIIIGDTANGKYGAKQIEKTTNNEVIDYMNTFKFSNCLRNHDRFKKC
jgi:uncharacterized protein RhaS with RHS repeats